MPISFSCECCKKKVKAPDSAGGKWGKCPHCGHKCYIPLPKSDDEPELRLAPIDDSEETQLNHLMRETHSVTHMILKESTALAEEMDPNTAGSERTASEKEIIKECILYLRQMADGELKPAERTLKSLKKQKRPALRIFSAMARAERAEPELQDLSDGVLQGLIHDAERKLT